MLKTYCISCLFLLLLAWEREGACGASNISNDAGPLTPSENERNQRLEFVIQEGHSDFTTDLSMSPHLEFLASSSRDKTVRMWDVSGNQLRLWSAG